jgi:hypothetical protein
MALATNNVWKQDAKRTKTALGCVMQQLPMRIKEPNDKTKMRK